MLCRTAQLSVGLFLALCPVLLSGQAAQPQYFIFCAAQAPPPAAGAPATVYYSGIMQGTAANMASFRTDFTQFLAQKYAYKGAAACAPANSMANAQTAMNNQQTAFRNAKRNVVDTGWTEGGAGGILGSISNPLGSILGGGQSSNAAPANQTKAAATGQATTPGGAQAQAGGGPAQASGRGGTGAGSGGGNQSTFNNVFGQIFGNGGGGGGNGGGGGAGGGAKPAQGQTAANGKPATGGTGAGGTGGGNGGGGGNQSPFAQVSSVIFGNRGGANNGGGNNGGGRGGQPGQPPQPSPGNAVAENNNAPGQPSAPGGRGGQSGQPAQQNGILGTAQFGTTKLDIYGCARQELQVACVTELTNQNPKDTLVKSADIWKDAFIVDDRGDRHTRTNAFFLNVDGEQRQQLDISNGKTAKFVLMFDQVPTKVQKVTLRSQTGGLDVEEMGLLAPDGSAPSGTTAAAPGAQH